VKTKPNLSMLALISFISAFAIARVFTTFYPDTVLTFTGGLHVHHFWYGLAMLAIGGWLGINYENERINRLAAVLFGAGGGIVGDEVGLLLTLGDYWTEITYTVVVIFITSASILMLISRYASVIRTEFAQFLSGQAPLYVGTFLAAVSAAFLTQTENIIVITISSVALIIALTIILAYLINQIRKRR